jgi:hypothetical protein
VDYTAAPLSASFDGDVWVYFNFTGGHDQQLGGSLSPIQPCVIHNVTIGEFSSVTVIACVCVRVCVRVCVCGLD